MIVLFPEFAKKVENEPKLRKWLSGICIAAALIGFIFDVGQRRSNDQTNKQLQGNVSDLVRKTTGLVTTANQTSVTIGVLMPQIAALNTHAAAIDAQLETTTNPRLIAELQAQKFEVQKEAAMASKRLTVALVSGIVDSMRNAYRDYGGEAYRLYNETMLPTNGATTPSKIQRLEEIKVEQTRLNNRYSDEMKQMITTADVLRRQLLQGISETDEDVAEERKFTTAITGDATKFDVMEGTKYLEGLIVRNR
jgi:hypothetical protein